MTGEHCRYCGRCCWDWKGNRPDQKCEYLAEDMRTCLVRQTLAEVSPECIDFPHPHCACDLPPDCGYMIYWREQGIL